jgi:hypothetical protein
MTVLSLPWPAVRPRRWATVLRNSRTARRERRAYRDSFFADPAAVEDDARRMRRDGAAIR